MEANIVKYQETRFKIQEAVEAHNCDAKIGEQSHQLGRPSLEG